MSWKEDLKTFIRWVMRDVTYHKHYSATVMSQSGDTADVVPDDDVITGIAGLQAVPIYWGTPGIKATVAPGAKVTLFFENGDKKKPRIMCWQSGAITISLAEGTKPIARVGDTVSVTDPVSGPITGIIVGGNPQATA